MNEQELILLGLLKESPKHGYEIKKKIKEILSIFAGVDLKSIYYPLRSMEKQGLVLKRSNRQGKRPERFVYELTPKGETRFGELLNKSFLDFKRPQFSLDLCLYFLHYMSAGLSKRRLQARMRVLENLSLTLEQMLDSAKKKDSLSLMRILEHDRQMVQTESRFLSGLIKTL